MEKKPHKERKYSADGTDNKEIRHLSNDASLSSKSSDKFQSLSPKPDENEKIKLGNGGSGGIVYRAIYNYMEVAVKVIPELTDDQKIQIQKECNIMQILHHDNICRLYDCFVDENGAILILELAKRGDLYRLLYRPKEFPILSWYTRLWIACQIGQGLAYLHSRDPPIIHRDLKSLNILLKGDGTPIIADFGISKIITDVNSFGTKNMGTPYWMAPEMLDTKAITTTAIDIYSFGMILYELLTRKIPFSGYNFIEVYRALQNKEKPLIPLSTECPSVTGVPQGYIDLMEECWNELPKKRPSIDQILPRLKEMLAAEIPVHFPIPVTVSESVPVQIEDEKSVSVASSWQRQNPWQIMYIGPQTFINWGGVVDLAANNCIHTTSPYSGEAKWRVRIDKLKISKWTKGFPWTKGCPWLFIGVCHVAPHRDKFWNSKSSYGFASDGQYSEGLRMGRGIQFCEKMSILCHLQTNTKKFTVHVNNKSYTIDIGASQSYFGLISFYNLWDQVTITAP